MTRTRTHKANPRRTNGARRTALRKRVLAAYDTCAICGRPIDKTLKTPDPMSPEIDEIIPVAHGGNPYSFTNLELTHRACNRLKSTHSLQWARAHAQARINQNNTTITPSRQKYTTIGL